MPDGDHVFISYSRRDGNEAASKLENTLQTEQFKVWRDIHSLHATQDFTADIEKGIEASSHVVVCITADSKRADSFVRREIQYALAVKKPVIPARFVDIPPHVSIINNEWVDFFKNETVALERLVEILRDPNVANRPGEEADDPFRPYLHYLYQHVVDYLRKVIIRRIDLSSAPTPDAVPERSKRRDMLDLTFSPHHDPAKVPAETTPEIFTTFKAAFDHYDGRVLLLGQPGAGKTVTLYAHLRDAIAARLDDPTQPLPLYGIITGWDSRAQTPLADWLIDSYRQLDRAAALQVVANGGALFLLDGLDELGRERPVDPEKPEGEKYDPRRRFVETFTNRVDVGAWHAVPLPGKTTGNQILVTCREEDYADIGAKIPLNGAVTLQPMGDAQIADYLKDQPELWDLVQSDPQLREIVETPLLLSFFAFAYKDMTAEERAQLADLKNAGDLRDRIFLTYIEKRYRYEEEKRRRMGETLPYTLDELLEVLGMIAMHSFDPKTFFFVEDPIGLHEFDFPDIFGYGYTPDNLEFVNLAVRLNLLVHDKDALIVRFVHLMLRDTLAYTFSLSHLQDSDMYGEFNTVNPALTLGMLEDVRAVTPLTEALDNLPLHIHETILWALERIAVAYPVVDMILALRVEDIAIRHEALISLGQLRDPITINHFIVALEDEDWRIRNGAINMLRRFNDTRITQPLTRLLSDGTIVEPLFGTRICDVAAEALEQIGTAEALAAVEAWRNAGR